MPYKALVFAICLASAFGVTAFGASAATLSATGDVLVNSGEGFRRAVPGQEVSVGDRIMIGRAGGTASVSYGGGCNMPVAAGRIVTVQANVPCNPANSTSSPVGSLGSNGVLIAGGLAAAVGVGVLIYNGPKSSSP